MGSGDARTSHGRESSTFRGPHAPIYEDEGTVERSGSLQHALDPLLLEAENVMTNPMFGMDVQGVSVPATPNTPAPQQLQAVTLQVNRKLQFLGNVMVLMLEYSGCLHDALEVLLVRLTSLVDMKTAVCFTNEALAAHRQQKQNIGLANFVLFWDVGSLPRTMSCTFGCMHQHSHSTTISKCLWVVAVAV